MSLLEKGVNAPAVDNKIRGILAQVQDSARNAISKRGKVIIHEPLVELSASDRRTLSAMPSETPTMRGWEMIEMRLSIWQASWG